jgi:TonB family protein
MKGETALMRAAFFGHAEVVRLLLQAGADVGMKDGFDLTAVEWSIRRGFDDITRLLRDPASAGTSPPQTDAAGEKVPREAAAEGRREEAGAAGRDAEAEARKPAEEAAVRRVGEESRESPQVGGKAEEAARIEAARIEAREELRRRVEESRRRVAEAVRQKSGEAARRPAEEETRGEPARPASTLEHKPQEPPKGSGVKRCPECGTTYQSDILTYCVYDSALLIGDDEASFGGAGKPHIFATENTKVVPLWVLVLVSLTFLGGGLAGYLINRNISTGPGPGATVTAQQEAARLQRDRPVTDGALKGKETSLPDPDYPEAAKREGVSGKVTVAVTVNNKGDVITARALSGHPLLQAAAEKAARGAKFSTEKQARGGAKASGTITYDFK